MISGKKITRNTQNLNWSDYSVIWTTELGNFPKSSKSRVAESRLTQIFNIRWTHYCSLLQFSWPNTQVLPTVCHTYLERFHLRFFGTFLVHLVLCKSASKWIKWSLLKNDSTYVYDFISFRELGAPYTCGELLRPLRRNCCSLLLWVLILNSPM